ncbi:MAG: hypothetical protein COV66_13865 [Nitrospinae bacterium CG11_big_fil_rev_8_21_14_0_20_45_15]|nr:MAG: hypothetical protein COV66_13865 [Nitrospinae bacterium CG11_big_fil_rev_8_21_14_0_20_45_15]
MDVSSVGSSGQYTASVQSNNSSNKNAKANEVKAQEVQNVQAGQNDGDSDDQGKGTNVNTLV